MKRSKKILFALVAIFILGLFYSCYPQLVYKNQGESISEGSVGNGSLKNAYLLEYRGHNWKYFSPFSYYILGNGYLNSKVYHTVHQSYQECLITCPDVKFRIMECSSRKGGKQLIHRTHRNGLSIDFLVPKLRRGKQTRRYSRQGIWHYLLNFNEDGKLTLNKKITIDFETIGKHIISLDNAAKKNGLYIQKVIFKINLKDDLFNTKYGEEIKRRGIYFARNLSKKVDNLHDDHYHIDFALL